MNTNEQQPRLYTSRWRTVWELNKVGRDKGFVPVRTSVGSPRFWPAARSLPAIGDLAPFGLMKLSHAEFWPAYRARLEKKGVAAIEAQIATIHAEYQCPLVLLCFEDVEAGELCHRRTFAEWWERETGEEVPELTESVAAALAGESLDEILSRAKRR